MEIAFIHPGLFQTRSLYKNDFHIVFFSITILSYIHFTRIAVSNTANDDVTN